VGAYELLKEIDF